MRSGAARVQRDKIVFWVILFLTILPIFVFPITSRFFQSLYGVPKIADGVLDLQGYHFNEERDIPLNGEWEFFWQKLIITDGMQGEKPDCMVSIPSSWKSLQLNGKPLPAKGYASYRIRLINCPENVNLIAHVPNLRASYRIFINGMQVSGSGVVRKNPQDNDNFSGLLYERIHFNAAEESELVVEVSSEHFGGLYLTPMLTENYKNFFWLNLRQDLLCAFIGILVLTMGYYAALLFAGDSSLRSLSLLFIDFMMLLRIMLKDELFGLLKIALPFFQYRVVDGVLQTVTMFLPIVFLFCIKELAGIQISKNVLRNAFLYEMICALPLLFSILTGRLLLQQLVYLISVAPFMYMLVILYRSIQKNVYALTASAGTLLILSSLMVANQYTSGSIIMNVSMYPPTCFVLFALLQDYIYIHKSNRSYKEAVEGANLRLRLKEAESSLMLSQIKPHFLYNALLAIQVLCTREPEEAAQAIMQFSKFLRSNMQFMNSREPIPFTQELAHIENYIAIEKLRFKERLTVNYEITGTDFTVPPLTIQPLLENAIKHGACKNVMGGSVWLKTREMPEGWAVEITDDGPGFDPSTLLEEATDSFGLRNIIFRLREWMGAEIQIDSGQGKGTRVIVLLPRGGKG